MRLVGFVTTLINIARVLALILLAVAAIILVISPIVDPPRIEGGFAVPAALELQPPLTPTAPPPPPPPPPPREGGGARGPGGPRRPPPPRPAPAIPATSAENVHIEDVSGSLHFSPRNRGLIAASAAALMALAAGAFWVLSQLQ